MASASDTEGYDYEFVPPVENDFVCAICDLALKEPVQTKCGHRFCQESLAKFHRSSPRRSCPMDNQDLNPQDIFLDVATNRKILSHQVKCPNEGCDWTGELRELIGNDKHLEVECPCSVISCEFSDIGCREEVQRCHMSQHLQSQVQQHLTLARKKIKELEVHIPRTCICAKTKFVWKISKFQQCIQKAKNGEEECILSDPFYTSTHGYKMKLEIFPDGDDDGKAKGTHLSVFIFIMKGEYDAILHWPFDKKIEFVIIDQQENVVDRENIIMSLQNVFEESVQKPKLNSNSGFGFPKFASHETIKTRKYILDDTLFLQVNVTDN